VRTTATDLGIQQLEEADAATLRRLWVEIKGTAPPKTFTARLMGLALAWDAQTAREGCETAKVRRDWNRIIKARGGAGPIKLIGTAPHPPVGDSTRILKEWGGTTHEVLIDEGIATWKGQSYSSLSAVARAMTGANRSSSLPKTPSNQIRTSLRWSPMPDDGPAICLRGTHPPFSKSPIGNICAAGWSAAFSHSHGWRQTFQQQSLRAVSRHISAQKHFAFFLSSHWIGMSSARSSDLRILEVALSGSRPHVQLPR